jgi:hypothetical protein
MRNIIQLVITCLLALTAANAQTLEGLYLQLQPIGTGLARVHYYFWQDGRMCKGLPLGGIEQTPAAYATYQTAIKKAGGECGQYSISGKQMSLKWQTSPGYTASFVNFKNNSFEMNQFTTAKVGFGSGQKLDGIYSATVVGNQMRSQKYAFHADGNYEFSDKPVTSRDGAAASSTGRYRIFGSTLELSGASGTTRLTAYPFPDGGISIEGTVFSK